MSKIALNSAPWSQDPLYGHLQSADLNRKINFFLDSQQSQHLERVVVEVLCEMRTVMLVLL